MYMNIWSRFLLPLAHVMIPLFSYSKCTKARQKRGPTKPRTKGESNTKKRALCASAQATRSQLYLKTPVVKVIHCRHGRYSTTIKSDLDPCAFPSAMYRNNLARKPVRKGHLAGSEARKVMSDK